MDINIDAKLLLYQDVRFDCNENFSFSRMNFELEESLLTQSGPVSERMEKWTEAQRKGQKIDIDVYGKPSEKQLRELEHVRSLSKELQDNLHVSSRISV